MFFFRPTIGDYFRLFWYGLTNQGPFDKTPHFQPQSKKEKPMSQEEEVRRLRRVHITEMQQQVMKNVVDVFAQAHSANQDIGEPARRQLLEEAKADIDVIKAQLDALLEGMKG